MEYKKVQEEAHQHAKLQQKDSLPIDALWITRNNNSAETAASSDDEDLAGEGVAVSYIDQNDPLFQELVESLNNLHDKYEQECNVTLPKQAKSSLEPFLRKLMRLETRSHDALIYSVPREAGKLFDAINEGATDIYAFLEKFDKLTNDALAQLKQAASVVHFEVPFTAQFAVDGKSTMINGTFKSCMFTVSSVPL